MRQAEGSTLAGDAFNASWHASLEAFVQYAFWEGGGNVSALLSSPTVFVDSTMNELYGFRADTRTLNLPYAFDVVDLGIAFLAVPRVIAFAVVLIVALLLWLFMRMTDTGKASRLK